MAASIIRTAVQLIVATLLGWALKVGLSLPSDAVAAVVTVVIGTAYYAAGRWIELRWPTLGRVLLSFGLVATSPVYIEDPSRAAGIRR